MKALLLLVVHILWVVLFYWLLGVICRAWHFPFWGVFWLYGLFLSGVSMQQFMGRHH
jgi:hypothetical protein